jgi:hypothetical protein
VTATAENTITYFHIVSVSSFLLSLTASLSSNNVMFSYIKCLQLNIEEHEVQRIKNLEIAETQRRNNLEMAEMQRRRDLEKDETQRRRVIEKIKTQKDQVIN